MPVVIFQMTAFKVVRELLVDKQKLAVAQTQQNIPSLVILQSLVHGESRFYTRH